MKIGIVGAPNRGKSTFFKSTTLADVEIADRPFVTIKPNTGIAHVKVDCADSFFNTQCNPRFGFCLDHKRFIPIELLDVAGLVPGSYEGKGLGNEFLNDLREADALIQVIDISGSVNELGEKAEVNSYYPGRDIDFLDYELNMWYYQILKKGWDKFARQVKQEKASIIKALHKQLSGLKVTEYHVEGSIKNLKLNIDNPEGWTDKDLMDLATELRHKSKPTIIAANKIDIEGSEKNLEKVKKDFPNYKIIPCSADSELALRESLKKEFIKYIPGSNSFEIISNSLNEKQINALNFIKKEVLDKYGGTGVQDLLDSAIFTLLKYIAVFPGGMHNLKDKDGRTLPDCLLLPNGSTALDFAFKIHTDIGNNFIKAFDVRKRIVVGKEHILKNLDVIEIATKK
ncbi:MAG TPA: redox-regulated ATPase YchF [Candidatus Nanoarchaeia archaeon]|nr:redox-regulated ATPase YchF [Candidatus Nanoarchaeia archaeon]